MISERLKGVLAPVVTPFTSDFCINIDAWIRHCEWLLAQNAGLAVFGTNSEANSLSIHEKRKSLDALIDAGVPTDRLLPGTGCCAIPETVELTRHAMEVDAAGVLMLPPFYYKNVSDDGVFASFAEVIEQVADDKLKVYLYHIPQLSRTPISYAVIERLLQRYPSTVAGIKDSSGDWNNTLGMLEAFQPQGFDVFCGSEKYLLQTLRYGGAGCISATANVNPGSIARLYRTWRDDDAMDQQQALNVIREAFEKHPMIPALKAALAHCAGDDGWRAVRPPLVSLDATRSSDLVQDLKNHKLNMPGLVAA